MKIILVLLFLPLCTFAFGQLQKSSPKPSQKSIKLSKGEVLTIKQHEDDIKRYGPTIKQFFKRDSIFNYMFLINTISPYLHQGDTLSNWTIVGDSVIQLTFKPKKK